MHPIDDVLRDSMAVLRPDYVAPPAPPAATLDDVLGVLRQILAELEALRCDVMP